MNPADISYFYFGGNNNVLFPPIESANGCSEPADLQSSAKKIEIADLCELTALVLQ